MIFDITKRESFEHLEKWVQDAWHHKGNGIIPTIILGYNMELREQVPDAIKDEEVQRFCKKLARQTASQGFEVLYYLITTEKGKHVQEAFDQLAKLYFEYIERNK